MRYLRCVLLVVLTLVGSGATSTALAQAGSASSSLAPLYPPPPWLVTNTEHVGMLFEVDAAAARELLPPELEPASNVVFLNMYVTRGGVGLGPFTSTYLVIDVNGYDSYDGSKAKWMVQGWYGPDQVMAALREVIGLPVKLGTTRHDRDGDVVRAVLSRNGTDVIESAIKLTGKGGPASGVNYYLVRKELDSGRFGFDASRVPWSGEILEATPISVEFKVGEKDPLTMLRPKKFVAAWMFRGTGFILGHTERAKPTQ